MKNICLKVRGTSTQPTSVYNYVVRLCYLKVDVRTNVSSNILIENSHLVPSIKPRLHQQ